jgi:hypothetical protein
MREMNTAVPPSVGDDEHLLDKLGDAAPAVAMWREAGADVQDIRRRVLRDFGVAVPTALVADLADLGTSMALCTTLMARILDGVQRPVAADGGAL